MQGGLISGALELLSPVTLIIFLTTLLLTTVFFASRDRDVPPGPIGFPYFGYWPFIENDNCHLKLDALTKKYGEISSFTSSGRLYINLGSIKAVREALITKSEYFGDRIMDYNLMTVLFRDGVGFINGEPWKVTRKFFLTILKERGTNSIKTSIAGPLYDSIKSTISDLKAKKGEPIDLTELLTRQCSIVLRLTFFGEVGVTEEQVKKLNELYFGLIQSLLPKSLLLCGNFAKYFIFPFMPHFTQSLKCRDEMEKMLFDIINDHKATYDPDSPRDIVDEYIQERDERRSKGDPTADYFTDKVLMGSLMQLMTDGVLSVALIMGFLIKNLLDNPEEQDKIYSEISEVVGLDRQLYIEDKSKLTYFNAYLQEAIRTMNFINFFASQECTKETTLGGYRIPKKAILLLNFYSWHHDSAVYEEPEKFNPYRFIQRDGKKRPDLPILFGIGKRSCLGEGFVMMQIFLLFSTLIQNFHLSQPEGLKKLSLEDCLSGNFFVCVKPRHNLP